MKLEVFDPEMQQNVVTLYLLGNHWTLDFPRNPVRQLRLPFRDMSRRAESTHPEKVASTNRLISVETLFCFRFASYGID